MDDTRNQHQIIRKDARNCFVESLNDAFAFGKVHLGFATYDTKLPAGQRQTNSVHIYIAADEFLELCRKTDYSLLAFQWADAIAPSLKGRCAEAACHGITKVVLPETELPVRESWPAICEELRRAGFPPAHTAAEGIWLDLTKEELEHHERNA